MALVYLATNRVNGKRYVGFTTKTLARRRGQHISDSRRGRGHCAAFHGALAKYGADSFVWEELFAGDARSALAAERATIEELRTLAPGGYNLTSGGERPVWSAESRAKVATVSRAVSEETKERRRVTLRAGLTPEDRSFRGNSRRGKPLQEQHKGAIGAGNSGKKRTPDVKAAMSRHRRVFSAGRLATLRMLSKLGAKQRDLADWFDVSQGTVSHVLAGKFGYGANRG